MCVCRTTHQIITFYDSLIFTLETIDRPPAFYSAKQIIDNRSFCCSYTLLISWLEWMILFCPHIRKCGHWRQTLSLWNNWRKLNLAFH